MSTDDLVGKLIIIGITFLDENEKLIEQYQTQEPLSH